MTLYSSAKLDAQKLTMYVKGNGENLFLSHFLRWNLPSSSSFISMSKLITRAFMPNLSSHQEKTSNLI
jgi:hypothetical protein